MGPGLVRRVCKGSLRRNVHLTYILENMIFGVRKPVVCPKRAVGYFYGLASTGSRVYGICHWWFYLQQYPRLNGDALTRTVRV